MNPLSISAFADDRSFSSLTLNPQQFQLFHPIGGVSASMSPHLMVNSRLAVPAAFVTTKFIFISPRSFRVPVITPFELFKLSPAGRFSTLYCFGFFPVAGILNKYGEF